MIGKIEGIKIYVNDETYTKYKKTLEDENDELQQKIEQLKDNWDKLKKHLTDRYNNGTESISYREVFIEIKEMMKEIEQGSDSNE